MRILLTALLCGASVLAADLFFRGSLLSRVRPVVLSPLDGAETTPPVEVHWDGAPQMRLALTGVDGERTDLGLQASPATIGAERFPHPGEYRLELEDPSLGRWARVERSFRVAASPAPASSDSAESQTPPDDELRNLARGLEAARVIRSRAQERMRFLREENKALRSERERLSRELETVYQSQDSEEEKTDRQEERIAQMTAAQHELAEENAALRQRLASVLPCSVWGYYGVASVHSAAMPRRILLVADARGRIFRLQPQCEIVRRADPTAATPCRCVGNSWGD